MSVTLISGSSVALTTGTETTLAILGIPGRFQLIADLVNFQSGDQLDLRVYVMATPTGTARVLEYASYMGLQPTDDMVKMSSVIPNDQTDAQALKFTATQSRGSPRSLLWKVLQVDPLPANFLNMLIDAQGRVVMVSGTVSSVLGTVGAVQGGFVTVSGAVIASAVQGGVVVVSGTVVVGTNNDKTGYSLSTPQSFNLIGNISGTVTNNYILEQETMDLVALLAMDERAVMGNAFYVDGTNGSDAGTQPGTRAAPFKTITRAVTAAQAHNHDVIILLPVANGTNTITETGTININKADVSVIGPGYDVIVTNNGGTNKDVFNITAEGVSLRQFRINTAGNSSNGVTLGSGASLVMLTHLWIEGVSQDGIFVNVSSRNRILYNHIYNAGRDGVRVNSGAGTGTYNYIQNNQIRLNQNGINLLGVDASNTTIQFNIIRDNITNGVLIAAGVANTVITDNRLINNGTNISDAGTNTLQQWNFFNTDGAGIPLAVYNLVSGSVIADRVWQYTGTRTVDYVRGLVGISGTVIAGTVLDKTGYSLSNPQNFNLIGNISGTLTNVYNVISGTQATFDPSTVWNYTGSKIVDAVKGGYVTASGVSVSIDYSLIWNYTGSKIVDAVKGGYVSASGISVSVTGITIDPSVVWNYSPRTLTIPNFFVNPVVTSSSITVLRGDTWSIQLTGLGNITTRTKLYFTVKRLYTDADGEAEVQVSESGGLVIINGGVASTPANASIVVNNATTGDITITVAAVETAKLDLLKDIYYDVQVVKTAVVNTLVFGNFTIAGDSSRATS